MVKLNLGAMKQSSGVEDTENQNISNDIENLTEENIIIDENSNNILNKNNSNNKKSLSEDKELFSAYQSEFSRKKETFVEKIKKAKNYVKPKTRLGFIAMLFSLTFLGIATLFTIAPDIHNIDNYKANLLKVKQKIECGINKDECNIIDKNKIVNSTNKQNIKIQKKSFTKYGIKITYKIKKINDTYVIIYNNKKYSELEWEKEIELIIKNIKKNKIRDFLKNKIER